MNRWMLITAGVVAALLVVVLLVWDRETGSTTTANERTSPIAKLDSSEITKLVIRHYVGEGEEKAEQTVVLGRAAAEGEEEPQWTLVEPVADEVNPSAINNALKRLDELDIGDVPASEIEASHDDLEVDDEGGVLIQVFAGETRLAHFILGKYLSGHTMLRLVDSPVVWRAKGSLRHAFGKRSGDWRNKKVFDFERDAITAVEFRNDNGTFSFRRQSAEGEDEAEWTIVSVDALQPGSSAGDGSGKRLRNIEKFNPSRVSSLLTSLAKLRCADFLDDTEGVETGLGDEDAARVSFTVGEGDAAKSYTLFLGAKTDKRLRYARRADYDGKVYVLTTAIADRLIPDLRAFQKAERSTTKAGGGPVGGGELPPDIAEAVQREVERAKMMKQLGLKIR